LEELIPKVLGLSKDILRIFYGFTLKNGQVILSGFDRGVGNHKRKPSN
jgi:hypothetical protein